MDLNPADPNVRPASPDHIDLLTMARFLALPGAKGLLEAFSRIPPGPLRQSVISHAEVIAETYAGAPAAQQMPDPLFIAAQTSPVIHAQALPGPGYTPKSQDEEIAARLLKGEMPLEIAEALGVSRSKAYTVRAAMAKSGVKLPKLKSNRGETDKRVTGFVTRMEDLTPKMRGAMAAAAMRRGMGLHRWLDARAKFVEMRRAGKPIDEIAAATKVDEKTLMGWLYASRQAGLDLPLYMDYADAEIAEAPEPEAAPAAPDPKHPRKLTTKDPSKVSVYRYPVFTPLDQLQSGVRRGMDKWAAARGWTAQQMFDKREEVVRRRLAKESPQAIAFSMGVDMDFVRNVCTNAGGKGVVFPYINPLPRADRHKVPGSLHEVLAAQAPADNVVRVHRWFGQVADLSRKAAMSIAKGAENRNLTPQAYLDLCESIVSHRMAGVSPLLIVQLTGENEVFVKDRIAMAKKRGAVLPPVSVRHMDQLPRDQRAAHA